MASSNFAAALETWRTINLAELQKKLDVQGIEIVDNQKEGLLGRKALADKTKGASPVRNISTLAQYAAEFKKLPDTDKLNAFKAYQTEIDSITKRGKTSDNAFLHVYKVLAEAPDPYPLLEAAVDQAVRVTEALEREEENKRLREENAELRKKLAELPTLEGSKKKLEVKVEQLEQKMDDMIQEKVGQKANELHGTYDERIRNYEEREQGLQKQVTLANNQLRDLRMSHDSNQAKLIDHSQRQDQEVISKLAEVDMIVADLDRANTRVASLERRNEILRAEIETLRSPSSANVTPNSTSASDRIASLEGQVADLEGETERLQRALEGQKAAVVEAEREKERKVDDLKEEVRRRGKKLEELSDYDEIKRELDIMKYVEFSGLEEDDVDSESELPNGNGLGLHLPDPNAEKANHEHGTSLEILLATKNKRMQEELTKFRILHTELQESLRSVEQRLDITAAELEKQKELNDKLENDLFSIDQRDSTPFATAPSAKGKGKQPATGEGLADDDSDDLLAGLDLNPAKRTSLPSSNDPSVRSTPIPFAAPSNTNGAPTSGPSADTSILPIVTSQRDRFRQRNAELEEELRKQYTITSELRAEIKNLQADNLKLYEKVRYMQSYRGEEGGASSNPYTGGSRPGSEIGMYPTAGTEHGDVSRKYQSQYEETINPFEAFRGREQTRAYQSLNPLERTVLLLTRPIMGSRRARTLFFLYAIGLHVLVMYTSYSCTASSRDGVQAQTNPYH
ncbi:hypothetical protein FA13DRAFT_1733679 [Coprinellus micaceus]|uniref:Protein CASP n=1 Tax=Coprinellus micaceus TaxID=71717 RepID=A0A4Y7T8A3_COPMI|nr:hypothetical protein FA13DRAFT_1733679 [Coprinellus micaceus]